MGAIEAGIIARAGPEETSPKMPDLCKGSLELDLAFSYELERYFYN